MAESRFSLSPKVFERKQVTGAVISDATYNLVLGLVLCWGFLLNWLIVRYVDPTTLESIHPLIFMIGYFASCLLGVFMFNTSKDPSVSFIGYNFVVLPFGLVLNIIVSRFDPTLVSDAISVTAVVTILMMAAGTMMPRFFLKTLTTLVISLVCMIMVELYQIFVLQRVSTWIDWVVVVIFCGYIGYDWARANSIPKTVDNAVDSAAAIYMDIINLFLRLLRILGRKR
ncbi:MAG: US12 family protein [bacterium]|nr:US12 family protein [bacterium]